MIVFFVASQMLCVCVKFIVILVNLIGMISKTRLESRSDRYSRLGKQPSADLQNPISCLKI